LIGSDNHLDWGPNRLTNCQQKKNASPRDEKAKARRHGDEAAADNNDFQVSIESLSVDVLANIFGFLLPVDIMNARVNNKMREAAREAIIPPTYELVVDSLTKYNAMSVMATALPNLQRIELCYLGNENKYVDGEDPDEEEAARSANYTAHNIEIIANFTKLRELKIGRSQASNVPLNGRYPCFFNFPLLQKLSISALTFRNCFNLKWNLELLTGLPSLKELECTYIRRLTGNLNSLRVLKDKLEKMTIDHCRNVEGNINSLIELKDTLEKLEITCCPLVEGNFMDLADYPQLKELHLVGTAVTGDIRDIGENDFPSLKVLALPKDVYGGMGYEFQRISDATDVARIPYLFQKQRPEIVLRDWFAMLSEDSPDMYESLDEIDENHAPTLVVLVRAGNRVGYQWGTDTDLHFCEVNWLDPEPDRESSEYGKYMVELQEIERQVDYFKGFYQPPPQEDFERILEIIHEDMFNDHGMGSELDSDSDSDSDSGDDEMEDN
jgi:hypothetical protein